MVAWDENCSQFNSICVHYSNESNRLTVKKRGEIRGVFCSRTLPWTNPATFEITEYALHRSRSRLELSWNLLHISPLILLARDPDARNSLDLYNKALVLGKHLMVIESCSMDDCMC